MGEKQALRPYQEAARKSIHTEWENGRLRTLLVLPTGTGKTIVFASVAADQVRAGDRVLILAHRGELLEQAADKLQRSTGLVSAVEKSRVHLPRQLVSGGGRLCPDPAAAGTTRALPRTTSGLSSSTRPTIPSPTATAASSTTSAVRRSWA